MVKWFLVEESQSPYRIVEWLNSLIGTKISNKGIVKKIEEWQICYDQESNSYTAFVRCLLKGVV